LFKRFDNDIFVNSKSLSHSGFQFYNNLPTHVKNVSKTSAFKLECMNYLKRISDVFYDQI
jgi:hypothetical protein